MTLLQKIITIAMCVLGTQITRWSPFLLVSKDKPTPKTLKYLGAVLPTAIFGFLIVMCLKNVSILEGTRGIPEFIGIAVTAIVHLLRKNMMLSIVVGTAVYMILVNLVFV